VQEASHPGMKLRTQLINVNKAAFKLGQQLS
jgi:hypothetical protein